MKLMYGWLHNAAFCFKLPITGPFSFSGIGRRRHSRIRSGSVMISESGLSLSQIYVYTVDKLRVAGISKAIIITVSFRSERPSKIRMYGLLSSRNHKINFGRGIFSAWIIKIVSSFDGKFSAAYASQFRYTDHGRRLAGNINEFGGIPAYSR